MQGSNARDRWRRLIAEQAGSGLSVAEFCRRQDVSQASFYQWRKKLGKAAVEPFVPVSIVAGAGVSVELPCGAVVRVPPGEERALAQIISLLTAAGERDG